MNMLKSLIIALAMYSKLPVPNIDWDEKNYEVCHVFFPLVVGVIIGALVFGAGQLILRYTECGKTLFCGGNDDDTGRCDRGVFIWMGLRIRSMPSVLIKTERKN